MKPKEFDELVRNKFDQNDFEYNPANWDMLEDQLDGRARKRNVIMLWLMPLAGVAASVALAIGVLPTLYQPNKAASGINEVYARTYTTELPRSTQSAAPSTRNEAPAISMASPKTAKKTVKHKAAQKETDGYNGFGIRYQNAVVSNKIATGKSKHNIDLLTVPKGVLPKEKKNQQDQLANTGYRTFREDEETQPVKQPKLSVILLGGINQGSQHSGYMAGATVRKMVNSKVYIESDVAFASANYTQNTQVLIPGEVANSTSTGGSAKPAVSAKSTTQLSGKSDKKTITPDVIRDETQSYTLNYAQLSPAVGVKVIRKMSIAAGPDFQRVLADNRPTPSTTVDKNNVSVAPLFDVGLIGKTEFVITHQIKAGVTYRKGINNVLTPMDKYIDRDYLQFQLKCAIFNR